MKLNLHILTPQAEVYKGEADEIIVPTVNGEIAVLPNHVSLITQILPGEMAIKNGGKTEYFAIMGGYLEIGQNNVNVLGDYAVRAENIEVAKAQAAKDKAEKVMQDKDSERNFAEVEAELRRSLLELKVARRRSGGVRTANS
jgi:F-type H+-transporting ATPase subunit epsilon